MELRVVTFADSIDNRISLLQNSCKEFGLPLEVLGVGKKWKGNAFKLAYLFDFLQQASDDELYLIVDAFDVVITSSAQEICSLFREADSDILFSAEANFYFSDRELKPYYWRFYPQSPTPYRFLNSGSFIGRGTHLKVMLGHIVNQYGIDFSDEEGMRQTKSDQYAYSRFYVDSVTGFFDHGLKIGLDHYQQLLGCTAGRMTAVKWPLFSNDHSFLFFSYERKLLRSFSLGSQQTRFRDFSFDCERFKNKLTRTTPPVFHIPVSGTRFRGLLESLRIAKVPNSNLLLRPLVFILSLFAYLQSLASIAIVELTGPISPSKQRSTPSERQTNRALFNLIETASPFLFVDSAAAKPREHRKLKNYCQKLLNEPAIFGKPTFVSRANFFPNTPPGSLSTQVIDFDPESFPALLGWLRTRKILILLADQQGFTTIQRLLANKSEDDLPFFYQSSLKAAPNLITKNLPPSPIIVCTNYISLLRACSKLSVEIPESSFLLLGSYLKTLLEPPSFTREIFPTLYPFFYRR